MQPQTLSPSKNAQALHGPRIAAQAARLVIAGILLSGPIALLVVGLVHPQGAWSDAEQFARDYHPIQLLPYVFGFVLITGCVALVASLATMMVDRTRAAIALVLAAAFAALISLNYILQTTFVPAFARPYDPEHAVLVEGFSMVNPRSLAWALEMWGYGLLGVATWLVIPVFGTSRLERVTAATFVANCVVSVVGAIATTAWPGWVMTGLGFVGFAAWNALMIAMGMLVIAVMKRR